MQVVVHQETDGSFTIFSKLTREAILTGLSSEEALMELECWAGFEEAERFMRNAFRKGSGVTGWANLGVVRRGVEEELALR